jgi:hypothetical protein
MYVHVRCSVVGCVIVCFSPLVMVEYITEPTHSCTIAKLKALFWRLCMCLVGGIGCSKGQGACMGLQHMAHEVYRELKLAGCTLSRRTFSHQHRCRTTRRDHIGMCHTSHGSPLSCARQCNDTHTHPCARSPTCGCVWPQAPPL